MTRHISPKAITGGDEQRPALDRSPAPRGHRPMAPTRVERMQDGRLNPIPPRGLTTNQYTHKPRLTPIHIRSTSGSAPVARDTSPDLRHPGRRPPARSHAPRRGKPLPETPAAAASPSQNTTGF